MSRRSSHPVVKGVAAGIGLISEYRHHRKAQNNAKDAITDNETPPSVTSSDLPATTQEQPATHFSEESKTDEHQVADVVDNDERQWSLDEAQDTVIDDSDHSKPKAERDPAKMVHRFTSAHPPTKDFEFPGLSLPVVLPQRRPKNRTRGFIRAYAPHLANCDITQETFMEFIETLNASTLASPWLDAINLASLAFVTLPTGISQALSIAITIAVDITKNMQSRHRHNYVLDQMNTEFFRPRGLYALVLTWKPDHDGTTVGVNLNETIADNLTSRQGMFDKAKHSFRPSMGNTVGVAFSETAPLTFPALDSLANDETPQSAEFKQKLKHAKGLVGDYFDRRAQAKHVGEHPNSQLAVTKPVFTSRYSDPNNPTNNGDVVSLLTAGKYSRPPRRGLLSQTRDLLSDRRSQDRSHSRFQRYDHAHTRNQSSEHDQDSEYEPRRQTQVTSTRLRDRNNGLLGGSIKRVFQHHVLYLAIINMPTEEELGQATAYLNQAQMQQAQPQT